MKEKELFLAGRIYQNILTAAKNSKEGQNKIIIYFGIDKDYDLITIIKILDKKLFKKAIFVVEPIKDYGCELIIHINKEDI